MAQDNGELLKRLLGQRLEFVIIGGVCGVFHGVGLVTYDLDICCRFDEQNIRRIEAAVKDLHPVHRLTPNKLPLELTSELCSRLKNLYLQTDLGKLDCLSEVAGIGGFDEVLKQSIQASIVSMELRFLSLEAFIASKTATGRERDRDAIKRLEAIREKLEQKKKS